MRNWPWPALAVLLALSVYLAVRVEQLDARLDALSTPKAAAVEEALEEGEETREELVDRVRSAEAEVATLKNELDTLSHRVDPALETIEEGGDETHILDVVEQENARIRERHLEFHRERWMEKRDAALNDFAARFGLNEWQVENIHNQLSREVDNLVAILKSKEAVEDPEQAASDWSAMLAETDRSVVGILEGDQVAAWHQARAIERAVLMPWLPKAEP